MKNPLLFVAIAVLFYSCAVFPRFLPGGAESEKLNHAKNTKEAREQFNSYPVETQIDIYLFGLKYIEPDDNSTQKFLVEEGEKKIPIIIQRIRTTDEEFDKAYLMEVVSLINKNCVCVTDDQKEILSKVGSSLKDNFHRSRFQRAREELNQND